MDKLKLVGTVRVRLVRKGIVIKDERFHNAITNEGKNLLLNIMFHGTAAVATWYVGLINASGFVSAPVGDTMGSHAGWTEFLSYTDISRPTWSPDAAADQAISNPAASYLEYLIIGTATLKGLFVASDATKAGTSGYLWSTAFFIDSNIGGDWAVQDSDLLQVQYGIAVS